MAAPVDDVIAEQQCIYIYIYRQHCLVESISRFEISQSGCGRQWPVGGLLLYVV